MFIDKSLVTILGSIVLFITLTAHLTHLSNNAHNVSIQEGRYQNAYAGYHLHFSLIEQHEFHLQVLRLATGRPDSCFRCAFSE